MGHDIMSEEAVRSWVKKKPRTARRQGFKVLGAEEGLVVLHWVSSERRLESRGQVLRVYKEPRPPLLSSVL